VRIPAPSPPAPAAPWTKAFTERGLPVPLAGMDAGDYAGSEFPGGFTHSPSYSESNLPLMIAMRARIDATSPGQLRDIIERYWARLDASGLRFLHERDRALAAARRDVAAGRTPRKSRSLIDAREREGKAWRELLAWMERLS
jgi:hypothetical protein